MANQWDSERLLSTVRGFMEARILLTGAELGVFGCLAGAPLTAEEAAAEVGAEPRPLAVVLDALTAMGLLRKEEGRYSCPPEIARLLSADSPETVAPVIRHHDRLWYRWSRLTEIVRGPHPAPEESEAAREAFIGAMQVFAGSTAERNVAAMGAGGAKRLLDVGGASGVYVEAFLKASPETTATLFDRPEVARMARTHLSEVGLLGRVTLVGGDFMVDPLPGGHDLALLSAIIHQCGPEECVALYRNVYSALVPGGRLVIRDQVMSPDHTSPRSGAIFAINMMVGTQGGRTYSFAEIESGLTEAGFRRVRLLREAEMDSLVEAFRP